MTLTRSKATISHGRGEKLVITKLASEPCRTPGELLVFAYTGSLKKLLLRSVQEWALTSTWTSQKEWRQARTMQIFSSPIAFKIILILIFWKSVITSFIPFFSLPGTLPRNHPCCFHFLIQTLYFLNIVFDLSLIGVTWFPQENLTEACSEICALVDSKSSQADNQCQLAEGTFTSFRYLFYLLPFKKILPRRKSWVLFPHHTWSPLTIAALYYPWDTELSLSTIFSTCNLSLCGPTFNYILR